MAAQVLGNIGERHLECSICAYRFRDPKMLHCFHSFCLQCLQDLSNGQDPKRIKLTCPLCRRETILRENGVADLPSNFTLSALVEEFAVQEKLAYGQESKISCRGCENNQAFSFCMDCAHFLCPECQSAHESVKLTKTHKICTLAQLQSGEVTYKSPLGNDPKCQKHPDQSLNLYCNTCQKVICTTCSVLDHKKHSRSDLSEASNECKREVAALAAQAEKKMTALSTAKNITDKARERLDAMFTETKKKITTKADKEVEKIRSRELNLTQAAEEIYKDRLRTLETAQATNNKEVTRAENTLDEVNRFMAEASCCEILDLKQKLLDNVKGVIEQEPEYVPDKLSFMDFQDADERSLGRLVLEDEWNLKTQIPINEHGSKQQDFRYVHMTAFSNKEIVAVDRKNKQLAYFVPTNNPQAPFISQELQTADLNDPTHVAVNKADQLIVLDGDTVKTLSREYRLLNQFRPSEKSKGKPTCLAVDDSNLIGVGYRNKKEISLHNPDGLLIRKLPAPKIGNHLTVSKKRFIYIDTMGKVRSVDYNGVMVNIHMEGKNAGVLGGSKFMSICCDSLGSMFMNTTTNKSLFARLLHVFSRNHDIQQGKCEVEQFSPDGKYIKTVTRNIVDAHGITFTTEGDLVVATGECIQIYRLM